jgi:hypothetical protein
MRLLWLGLCSVILLAAGTGCRQCASPYDYCGPVLENTCSDCGAMHRAGSAFTGGGEDWVVYDEAVVEGETFVPDDAQPIEQYEMPEEFQLPEEYEIEAEPVPTLVPAPAPDPLISGPSSDSTIWRVPD